MKQTETWTVPNVLTLGRLAAAPTFGALWATGEERAAFWVLVAAAVSDVLDGLLARWLRQHSRVGALLDPAADKLMLLVGYVAAALVGAAPPWLAVLVVGRDVLMSAGAGAFALWGRRRLGPERWRPSRLGKYTTFFQSSAVALALFERVWQVGLGDTVRSAFAMAAAMTVVSSAQYGWLAARALGARREIA